MAITVRFRSLMATICLAAASVATATVDRAWRAWRWSIDALFGWLKPAEPEVYRNRPGPQLALIAAKQYLMRQVKRERPQLSPSWRLCPSA